MSDVALAVDCSFKARLKRALQERPGLWRRYWRSKQELKRVAMLRYYFYDIRHTYRAMFWPAGQKDPRALSAELLFQYHKLEKGLVMPGPRRLFGIEPALAVIGIIGRWRHAGHGQNSSIFQGAMATLRAYRDSLLSGQLDPDGLILPRVTAFLAIEPAPLADDFATPQVLPAETVSNLSARDAFMQLANARRSVRDFLPGSVDASIISEAVRIAQLSPSACNRQPCSIFLVNDEEKKRKLLALQNGNRGFGHLAPHIAIISADERCFFDASERHEPYVDGGLFAMSFILALRAQGIGSCCLNWCVAPATDREAHMLLKLDAAQRIVMLVAFGRVPDGCMVPRSPRRDLCDVLVEL